MLSDIRLFSACFKVIIERVQAYDIFCDLIDLHSELHVNCIFLFDFVSQVCLIVGWSWMDLFLLNETNRLRINRNSRIFLFFLEVKQLCLFSLLPFLKHRLIASIWCWSALWNSRVDALALKKSKRKLTTWCLNLWFKVRHASHASSFFQA